MQSPDEFVKDCGYPSLCLIAMVSARDAEWQARVDRAVDEAVAQAKKVAQASEDIRARDAEIRRECAENAIAWLKTLHHKPEPGLPWSEKIKRMQELQIRTLRAAIIGEEG